MTTPTSPVDGSGWTERLPSGRFRRYSPLTGFIAWLVILACVGHAVWQANAPPSAAQASQLAEPGVSVQSDLTARMCVALGDFLPQYRPRVLKEAEAMEQEGVFGRLAYSVMLAELESLESAQQHVEDVRSAPEASDLDDVTHESAEAIADTLMQVYAAPLGSGPADLSAEDQQRLNDYLGWSGELAPLVRPLADPSPERSALLRPLGTVLLAMGGFALWLLLCGGVGLAVLIVLLVRSLSGRLRHDFRAGSGHGVVYAEAFAWWLLIFEGAREAVAYFGWQPLAASIAITLAAAAIALCWPVVRGVPWSHVRQDLGLHAGRGLIREVVAGVLVYCSALPLLLVGFLLTVVLMLIRKSLWADAPPPSHPVQQMLMGADWLTIAQIMLLGAVVAPVVEETLFRGALFRHLRDGTQRFGVAGSLVIAAGVSSILFAAIHPQGWTFIPVLASLAVAFCIGREWRDSLLPGIVAHGLNNFIILSLNLLLFG